MPRPLKRLAEEDDDDVEIDQPDLADDDPLRAFMPQGFGRQSEHRDVDEMYEKTRRVPKVEKKPKPPSSDSDDDDSDDDSDDDELPTTHAIVLKTHTKTVSSVSLDPSGTRLATASHDTSLRLYDFPAMSVDRMHAFKSIEPVESHLVHSATFSQLDSGQSVLVIPAAIQAIVYTRDGEAVTTFAKGDMYLRDMHNTKGHVAEITAGCWSPYDANIVATASTDSTIRIWDIYNKRAHRDIAVHKSRTGMGGRSRMCCLAWANADATRSLLGSVALDGSLVVYSGEGPYTRPAMEVRNAHAKDTWTSGIVFSDDGRLLITRGQDEVINLWDTRKLKAPVTKRTGFAVPTAGEANLVFSPKNDYLLTGDSAGNLHILSPATLRSEEIIPITPGVPVISVAWHAKLNQILCGSVNGHTTVLYSPTASHRGAKLVVTNAPRKRHIDDDMSLTTDATAISGDAVILPNALLSGSNIGAVAGVDGAGKQPRRVDPRAPVMPQVTPWGKNQPDQAHIEKSIKLASMRDEDPREALLKYAEKAEKDPMFMGVYEKTQPKTIYADIQDEDDEEEAAPGQDRKRIKRR